MTNGKVQFNFKIPRKLAERARADARRNGKTLDDVCAAIFLDFFNAWGTAERAKFYSHARNKTVGRRLAAARASK